MQAYTYTLGSLALLALFAAPASAQSIRIDGDSVVIDSGGVRIQSKGSSGKVARAQAKAARARAKAARARAKAARSGKVKAELRSKGVKAEVRSSGVRFTGSVDGMVIEGKGFRLVSPRAPRTHKAVLRVRGDEIDAAAAEIDAAAAEIDAAMNEVDAALDEVDAVLDGPVRLQRVERRSGAPVRVRSRKGTRLDISGRVTVSGRTRAGNTVRVDSRGVRVNKGNGSRVRVDSSGVRVQSRRGKRRTQVRVGSGSVRVLVD